MKTILRYFKHHAKDSLIRLAIITFICLVIVTLVTNGVNETYIRQTERSLELTQYGYYESDWALDPQLGYFVAISVILTTLLPMLELSCFNNRRYLDSAFSFPISRISLISVNLINGFLQFLIAYTVSFIWYAITLLPCVSKISYPALWSFFFISLLCSLFYYSVNAFFFSICNSSVDGFLTASACQFILCPLLLTLDDMFNQHITEESVLTILWMPLVYTCNYFTRVSKGYEATPDFETNNPYAMLIYLIVIPILTALFVAGTLYFFNKRRAESAGEISRTAFSYATLIPVCVAMLIYWALNAEATIISLFALIFSTVGYIIYRRSVKLKIFDIIVIAACFVCFVMGLIA